MAISNTSINNIEKSDAASNSDLPSLTQYDVEQGTSSEVGLVSPLLIRQAINARLAEGISIDGGQL